MLGMDMPHAHALFSHSTGPYSARRSGKARATPSVGKIFAPCMIPGTSTQKKGLPGKILALCIRNRPIVPRNGYMGRRSCQLQREKHASRANAASEALFSCNQRKENTWRANLATAAKATNRQTKRQPKERSWNNSQIAQHQGDTHKTIVLSSPKQHSNQPVTKTIPARAPILAA